jgi:large subunit ribosomal protein L15
MKGQNARAGGGTSLWHQGGNLPFFRRLPFKRGFTNINRVEYNEVNLDQLVAFGANQEVNPDALAKARLLRDDNKPVVILGRGDVEVALKVSAHRVTKGARAKIEAAGGSVEIIE